MQKLFKKAQTLLDIDLDLMVKAVLEDDDLKLLSDYIRLLQRHIVAMDDMIGLLTFSIQNLYEQVQEFDESASIEMEERREFEDLMLDYLSETAMYIRVVGAETPWDAHIADELREQCEVECDLHDRASDFVASLTIRMEVAESISGIVLDAQNSGKSIDEPTTTQIERQVDDEIARVKQSMVACYDDNVEAYLDYLRQQIRDSRRLLRDD